MKVKMALVDDHVLLRNGLANLLRNLDHEVLFEADNGRRLMEKIDPTNLPNVVLMDINMPLMDGYETTAWLAATYPSIKVLALSMYDDENAIIRMIRSGARGYILKDSDPMELKAAIQSLLTKNYYHSEMVTGKLIHAINHIDEPSQSSVKDIIGINAREIEFLKWACTELTYKQIAEQMNLSVRTIDGYRDALFDKLNLKSRTGLVVYAIKHGIVKL